MLQQCNIIKLVLLTLQQVSGLSLNVTKSELILMATDDTNRQAILTSIACQATSFPLTFLGLPLSDSKPQKEAYLPLLGKITGRLNHWSAKLLSFAGRLVLLNACLTAIPIYFMSTFQLPAWVINKIDAVRRNFLWKGDLSAEQKPVTVSWKRVCSPKKVGGLGVLDIKTFNMCLLSKWYWRWRTQPQANWSVAIQQGRDFTHVMPHSALSAALRRALPAINSNMSFVMGSGTSVSFWHHHWGLGILAYRFPELYSYATNVNSTVYAFLQSEEPANFRQTLTTSDTAMQQLQHLRTSLQGANVSDRPDLASWRLDIKGFSTASLYSFLKTHPRIRYSAFYIWKIKAPPRMITFTWLLLQNKLPTVHNLKIRGFSMPNTCVLCRANEETARHITRECLYTHLAWDEVASLCHLGGPRSLWKMELAAASKIQREILVILTFMIWRERCNRIFRGKSQRAADIVREAWGEWKILHRNTR